MRSRDNPDARIFGVCDTDAEGAARRAEEWGAERTYTDYRELLADRTWTRWRY